MDNTGKFSGKAEIYAKFRPSYPFELMKRLEYTIKPDSVVADIGAGTGIFTKCLCYLGCEIIAVEPNMEMLSQATENLKNYEKITYVKSPAEDTMLAEKSLDLITVAQAFHWFDAEKFKNECKRILKPDGQVLLVWNTVMKNSAVNRDLAEITRKYCKEYAKSRTSENHKKEQQTLEKFFENYETLMYENNLTFSKDAFVGNRLSRSYAPKESDKNYAVYVSALEKLFDKYAEDDKITVPNMTECYIGNV